MKKLTLKVDKRDVLGKKVKKLRREGLLPANIYGTGFKSTSVTANLKDFSHVYKTARETGVVHLDLDKKEIPVLIKSVQRHPVSDLILHVDFRKIDLTQKIQTEVPVAVVGTSEAVAVKGGVLLVQSNTLTVEALPSDIPSKIEVDISVIKEVGGEIKVQDLKKSDKYEFKTVSDKVVVSVVAHKEESVTPDTVSAQPEVITEAPVEGEAVEGEAAPTEEAAAKPTAKPGEAPKAPPSEKKATPPSPQTKGGQPPAKK